MTIVSAFLLPGNPLPFLRPDNQPWGVLAAASKVARESLLASKPDVLLIYSTQWFAVLDELWQARPHSMGLHVDENWYEYGDLQMNISADVELVTACIKAATDAGIRSKPVDYDHFPIDTGTIVANNFLNPDGKIPAVIASNNLYHDFLTTEKLGQITAGECRKLGRRAAVIAIGGLSGSYFDKKINIADDHIVHEADDIANKNLLQLMSTGNADSLRNAIPDYAKSTKADMGMKHLAWLLGATGNFSGAKIHGYGPTYGAGAAVVEFNLV